MVLPQARGGEQAAQLAHNLAGQQHQNVSGHPDLRTLDLQASEVGEPPILASLPQQQAASLQSAAAVSGLLSKWQVLLRL